jgi:hypothetical protein
MASYRILLFFNRKGEPIASLLSSLFWVRVNIIRTPRDAADAALSTRGENAEFRWGGLSALPSPSLTDSATHPPQNPGFPLRWRERLKPGQALSGRRARVVP